MNRIADERKKLGITQAALAKVCGWTQSRIANYESGIRVPGLNASRHLVMAFSKLGSDVDLDNLFPPKAA